MFNNRSRFSTVSAAVLTVLAATTVQAAAAPADAGSQSAGAAAPCPRATGVVITCGVRYADDRDPAHTLDIYQPADVLDAPVVLMVHGGGWSEGTSIASARQAVYFARNGLAAVSINYTLATRADPGWPTTFDDVDTSAAWVRAHGAAYGVDGTTMGAFGGSAGGHLAMLLTTDGHTPIIAAVSLSGPTDLGADDGVESADHIIEQFLGCAPSACPGTAADASPVTSVDRTDGDVLLFNSALEQVVPVSQAKEMDAVLTRESVPHDLVIVPGSLHAMAYECALVTVEGVRQPVIDASFSYLASRLMTGEVPVPGGYCKP